MNPKNLEQVRNHHVAIGAGLLVEGDAVADVEGLRHVDLNMVDEIAVPDRLEQAVGEPEREDVLRRLLAEEVVDAENLILGEDLVQRVVERDRGFEIGAERLFHDDARSFGEIGLGEHLDRRQRGVRRHAHVVDALSLLAERFLRLVDRGFEGFGPGRDGHVIERFREGGPCLLVRLAVVSVERRLAGDRAEAFDVDRVERHADDPAFRNESGRAEMKKPRQQLLVRQISGRAEQHYDLRNFGADPDRRLGHCVLHPSNQRKRVSPSHATEARQGRMSWRAADFTAAVSGSPSPRGRSARPE